MAGPVANIGVSGSGHYRVDWGPRQREQAMAVQGIRDIFGGIKAIADRRNIATLAEMFAAKADHNELVEYAGPRGLLPQLQQMLTAQTALAGPQPDPYTLGKDQVRFGGDNQPVARGPVGAAKESSFAEKLRLMGAGEPGTPSYAEAARNLAMRPTTTIDARSPPRVSPGHHAVYDDLGRFVGERPNPGGPAEIAEAERKRKAGERTGSAKRRENIVSQHVGAIRKMVEGESWFAPVTGMAASLMQSLPASAAHDMQQRIATLKALVGFQQLNEMRAQSSTGGALGNVTERELGFLQSVIGSLEQSQSEAQFLENLALVENAFNTVIDGPPRPARPDGPRNMVPGGYRPRPVGLGLPDLNTRAAAPAREIGNDLLRTTLEGDPSRRPPATATANPVAGFAGMDLSGLKAHAAKRPPAEMGDAEYNAWLARLHEIAAGN